MTLSRLSSSEQMIKTSSLFNMPIPPPGSVPKSNRNSDARSFITIIIVGSFRFHDNSPFILRNDTFVMDGEIGRMTTPRFCCAGSHTVLRASRLLQASRWSAETRFLQELGRHAE